MTKLSVRSTNKRVTFVNKSASQSSFASSRQNSNVVTPEKPNEEESESNEESSYYDSEYESETETEEEKASEAL